jgi:DNA-binding NarL/FixJ family response regulator
MNQTIAIADDHLLIAKALTGMIEKMRRFTVLYEVENGLQLTERMAVPANVPDIVLLDVSMPVMDGFETAAWLKQHFPGVLVMALSMQDDEPSLIKMIKNGARGYLLKNVHPAELEKALNTLVEKGFYYPDWVTSKVMLSLGHD